VAHIDAKPLGDLPEALLIAVVAWPDLDIALTMGSMTEVPVFDSRVVRDELGEVPLAHADIKSWLRQTLEEAFGPLLAWHRDIALGTTT